MNEVKNREHVIYLSLGSNIEPNINLPMAVALIRQYVTVDAISKAWETSPVGSSGANFLNAVAMIRTLLSPEALKTQVIREIEVRMKRVRTIDKNAPRTIDLDILLVDNHIYDPLIWIYPHLAVPLAEILPDYAHPTTGETLSQVATRLAGSTHISARPEILPGLHANNSKYWN